MAMMRWPSILLLGAVASASAQTPHLSGRVTVDPSRGLLDGRLCLFRFTPRSDLRFVLSAAVNLMLVSDSTGRSLPYAGEYNGRLIGEAREYVVTRRESDSLPGHLCLAYRGAVPPFDSNTATTDWKGRVTSIGGVLRASEQSTWYPTLLDSASGRLERAVSYDLTVECTGCRSIYLNGSRPIAGSSGRFSSSVPRPLLLLAGELSFQETPDITLVGGRAGPEATRAFSAATRELAGYYERLLGIPYRERPTLLTFRSVWSERPDGVPSWQFVTWPTIAISGGVTFDSVLAGPSGARTVPHGLWTTLSHEMGHYYFGTLLDPVGPLRWFALESTAEFLSLKAVAALRGPEAGVARAIQVAQGMGQVTLPRLDQIRRVDDITGTYRYQYAPAFLLTLEARHGEAKVLAMLRELLATPAGAAIDFERLAGAAERAGLPRAALTDGWAVENILAAHAAQARRTLDLVAARPGSEALAEEIASALVNVDTTRVGRLAVLAALQRVVARDPDRPAAQYQIGKIGALTGQELDVAQAALKRYLRHPAPPGSPSHAAAYWRLGQIEEHRGRLDQARAAYRAALERDPAYGAAREALSRLGGPPGGQR